MAKHGGLALIALCCMLGMFALGGLPASAATTPGSRPGTVKPTPARPPSTPGLATGRSVPAKPHPARGIVPADNPTGWTVTLTASSTDLWPTQYSTLTATANSDVGPTPYYIRIYDLTSDSYVASCGSGTTCSIALTEPTASYQDYVAVISDASASYPPGSIQATSSQVAVLWQSVSVGLAASPTTLGVGGTSTLTATTSADVGPSPFYIEIFDATTGTFLTDCGFGTSCSVSVSQSTATTHEYVAYVSDFGEGTPPPGIQATSATSFVTWTGSNWTVSLTGPGENFGSGTYTATANGDVGPTPWWIEIWDETTNTMLTECASGSTCSISYTPSRNGENLVAFVASTGSAFPPANIQASSNVLFTYFQIIP